jgi:hypothetical protein
LKDAKRTVEQELVLQKHLSAKYPSKNGLETLLKNVITREKLCSVDVAIDCHNKLQESLMEVIGSYFCDEE